MTKEEAWKRFREEEEREIGCHILLPSWLHEGFMGGYDACLNRVCKCNRVGLSDHERDTEFCPDCGGKIEEE
jgi:hypothetical protein